MTKPGPSNFLALVQDFLEENYGAKTGLNVLEFVRPTTNLKELGKMLVEQLPGSDDLNIALLLDRDILASFDRSAELAPGAVAAHRWLSVSFEEVSHFVYLSYNHNRGRNITALELELQSEVDRILLAYHSGLAQNSERHALLSELFNESYQSPQREHYETARTSAAGFVRNLCQEVAGQDPRAWTKQEFSQLRRFFHSDLPEKLHLCRKS